ncbi:C-C motif chemokine 6-like isoform X1 [Chionomys nivalis]|uniref:C-C motif chemokine 6-like isoform X1 n=1 Tax=Chionomys nivalis TaxID=269649 RepID=UPI002599D217|nr:C-C motif chemokine 6-like isoform X1 [Chionomys nivalis]
MRNLRAAVSVFILVAVLGSQARITPGQKRAPDLITAIREKRVIHRIEPHAVYQGILNAPDCCFSYVYISRSLCSRFVYYFPTSGGCITPGIIFVSKRGIRVCANPLDQEVQKCIRRLTPIPGPGSTAIA